MKIKIKIKMNRILTYKNVNQIFFKRICHAGKYAYSISSTGFKDIAEQ